MDIERLASVLGFWEKKPTRSPHQSATLGEVLEVLIENVSWVEGLGDVEEGNNTSLLPVCASAVVLILLTYHLMGKRFSISI